MKISELIAELQSIQALRGDLPVVSCDNGGWWTSKVFLEVTPYYYDGGYIYPEEKTDFHCTKWVRSRTKSEATMFVKIRSDYPEEDYGDTLDGVEVRSEQTESVIHQGPGCGHDCDDCYPKQSEPGVEDGES